METRTRPILRPLIQGTQHCISTFDQKFLATWIAKTIMVAEYTFPQNVAIPDSERLWMLAHLAPPPHWQIWIANYHGTKWRNLAISHHMARLRAPESGEPSNPDTHFSSIGIGHLFVQVAVTTSGFELGLEDEAVSDLRRIWPPTNLLLVWPPGKAIVDIQADFIATSLSRIAGIPVAV